MHIQQPAEDTEWPQLGIPGRNSYRVSETKVDMRRPQAESRPIELEALPQKIIIDLARSALIIVDMQNDFCGEGGWISSMGIDFAAARDLVAPISSVAAALRRENVPVLWVN